MLDRESILTCVDVAVDGMSRTFNPDEDGEAGRDNTMVPMFDITISH